MGGAIAVAFPAFQYIIRRQMPCDNKSLYVYHCVPLPARLTRVHVWPAVRLSEENRNRCTPVVGKVGRADTSFP